MVRAPALPSGRLPLRLGVMAAIVGGIAAGFATEHLQKKPEAR